jgi:hypothetical protein
LHPARLAAVRERHDRAGIHKVFLLAEAAEAHRLMESATHIGFILSQITDH